jgi:hypothetical protein
MSLVEHAKRELALLGSGEDDFGFNDCIIKSIEAFAVYGHSGGSASVAIPLINELLQFKNLTPLTDDPSEWNEVGKETWQSSRNPEAFSTDGGRTYSLLSERIPIHESMSSKQEADGSSGG